MTELPAEVANLDERLRGGKEVHVDVPVSFITFSSSTKLYCDIVR